MSKHTHKSDKQSELDKYGHDPITFGINYNKLHPELTEDTNKCELWCYLTVPDRFRIKSTYMMYNSQKVDIIRQTFSESYNIKGTTRHA